MICFKLIFNVLPVLKVKNELQLTKTKKAFEGKGTTLYIPSQI